MLSKVFDSVLTNKLEFFLCSWSTSDGAEATVVAHPPAVTASTGDRIPLETLINASVRIHGLIKVGTGGGKNFLHHLF